MLDKNKVINVKFTRRGKGYDTLEVDDFLDEIVAGLEELEQNRALETQKLEAEKQSLISALSAAQMLAKEIEINAKREAEYTLRKSRNDADEYIKSIEKQYQEVVQQINRLKQFYDSYRTAVLRDMDSQRDAFLAGFLSESVYAELSGLIKDKETSFSEAEGSEELVLETSELPDEGAGQEVFEEEFNYFGLGYSKTPDFTTESSENSAELEPEAAESSPAATKPKSKPAELDTGDMGSINLDEIISGLPQTDDELKALIDEIM